VCFVQLRIAKVNLVTGTQDSSTSLAERRNGADRGHLLAGIDVQTGRRRCGPGGTRRQLD
ncbi:MAG: hypothetical protein MZU79_00905, partial [Anaerotruncus sp.]|nr:hypothetical protein [Anaerotruncus sp.]